MKFLSAMLLATSMFSAHAHYEIEAGLADGKAKGEDISATTVQIGYFPKAPLAKILGGNLSYGVGFRSTFYKADLFQAGDDENELLEDVNVSSHNIYGQLHYQYGMVQVGFNIDVLGLSSSSSSTIRGTNTELDNETTNVFLGGKDDKGSLNSQLFIAVHFTDFLIKAGTKHSVIEFEDTGLSGDNTRQRFFDSAFVALGYKF